MGLVKKFMTVGGATLGQMFGCVKRGGRVETNPGKGGAGSRPATSSSRWTGSRCRG